MPTIRGGDFLFGSEANDPPRRIVRNPEVAKNPNQHVADVLHPKPSAVRTD